MWVVGYVPEFLHSREQGRNSALANLTTIIETQCLLLILPGTWKMLLPPTLLLSGAYGCRGRSCAAVRDVKGRIGHNNIVKDEHDTEAVLRIGATTVADFVALRNSDMLVGFLSNFPKRAGQGAVCPQRWYELRSRERPDDVREHVREMDAILRNTKTDDFIPSEPRTLAQHMPEGHPCLDADDPVHDCDAFIRSRSVEILSRRKD